MMIKAWMHACLAGLRSLFAQRGKAPDTTPQSGIDTEAYLGRWYEQARYDHFFERGLDFVYADYTRREDGSVRVLNTGHDRKGRRHSAEGRATLPEVRMAGRMLVSFVPPYRWFRAPYHILYTDSRYQEALVSGEGDRYLWLLTREREANADSMRRLLDEASRRGFDIGKLRLTHQKRKSTPAET